MSKQFHFKFEEKNVYQFLTLLSNIDDTIKLFHREIT